ncbi:peptidase M20 [Lachnospiraceae bacterium]|uniref:amidohydrolase n=1 Tax=Extibacter sp. GGCC_0201 TaxID=2731209 RepID=UPI001AA0D0B9|nr:amidohydrolase [Extibacter sp. GGCC_0201]MBO1719856.1 amidohydrolase [Extibacter sp. GGCC_0201]BDF35746.1 peptidase M20 [Lachnospiraceae bacterium]BDF39748.1 peptidase M20 [Lachnospiraceae bacterium]
MNSSDNLIAEWLSDHEASITAVADYIFRHPETAYKETLSSRCLADFLEAGGFQIAWKTAGIDTAFTASWGKGKPAIGFLAEYDALAEIGHACGHNLLGTAVAAAACALKAYMEASGMDGTLLMFGCPAEEIMSGKIIMNRQGVFDSLDAAVTWHPFDRNRVSNDIWQSQDIKNYIFRGVSAHASRSPEEGRSALDACELMNVGVNYLREHVPQDVRMHYAYKDNGLPANVVPDYAQTNYFIRSSKRSRTEDASSRVDDCARGAALMTGTELEIELVGSCKEMKVNRVLSEIYYDAMTRVPVPEYTEDEIRFAAQISEKAGLDNGGIYFQGLEPLEQEPVSISIGTDVSEVSHTLPTITLSAAAMCRGTPLHHWAAARQAGMSIGRKGMLYAARCMAEGTKQLIEKPENLQDAWKFHLGTG